MTPIEKLEYLYAASAKELSLDVKQFAMVCCGIYLDTGLQEGVHSIFERYKFQ